MLFGPSDLRIVEVPQPRPERGQVTVRVMRSSPYGTDVGLYLAERHRPRYPVGLGADFSGVVEEVGPAVEDWHAGDRVVAMEFYHCGHCRFCLQGRTNLCLNDPRENLSRQECFEEVALVWANKLARLPDRVCFDDGALLTGLMTGVATFEKLAPAAGETLLVIGAGAMGQPLVALGKDARLRVLVAGHGEARLDICRRLGADDVLDDVVLGAELELKLDRLTAGGPDCVIETTVSAWGEALSLRVAGRCGRVGWIGGPAVPVDGWQMVSKEIALFGVRGGHHQRQALDLIAAGRVDLKPSITHRATLEDLPDVFGLLSGPNRGSVGRVMIEHLKTVGGAA